MAKRVGLSAKTTAPKAPVTADEWVNGIGEKSAAKEQAPVPPSEPMKRLTIDVSESLHTAIKSQCAARGVKMADEIRELLQQHFAS